MSEIPWSVIEAQIRSEFPPKCPMGALHLLLAEMIWQARHCKRNRNEEGEIMASATAQRVKELIDEIKA